MGKVREVLKVGWEIVCFICIIVVAPVIYAVSRARAKKEVEVQQRAKDEIGRVRDAEGMRGCDVLASKRCI